LIRITRSAGWPGRSNTRGFGFDIGGHRFFTKVHSVTMLWREMLGDEFLRRPRLSRIFYRQRFFDYPLKPLNALWNLGILTSLSVMLSRVWIQMFPIERGAKPD
jgi:protoporphyrinogen oxidase